MLPEKPVRPHDFYEIDRKWIRLRLSERYPDEINVCYREKGEGPPLVLVHGLMTSSYSYRYNISDLSRDFRVVVPDLVGSGDSDKPLDFSYSCFAMAEFLAAFTKTLGLERPFVVGNSLGGLYTIKQALDFPDTVSRLMVTHCPGYPMARTRLLSALLRAGPLVSFAWWLMHRFAQRFVKLSMHYHHPDTLSLEEIREYAKLFDTTDGALAFMKILRGSMDYREHARIIDAIRTRGKSGDGLPAPVLLVWAKQDKMVPARFGPMFNEDIKGSRLVVLSDTSHFIHVESPGPFHRLAREFFLDREKE